MAMPRQLPIIDITPSKLDDGHKVFEKSFGYQKETRDCLLVITAGLVLSGLFSWSQHWFMATLLILMGAGLSFAKLFRLDRALKIQLEEQSSLKTVIIEED
jgi:hypothetical protein